MPGCVDLCRGWVLIQCMVDMASGESKVGEIVRLLRAVESLQFITRCVHRARPISRLFLNGLHFGNHIGRDALRSLDLHCAGFYK